MLTLRVHAKFGEQTQLHNGGLPLCLRWSGQDKLGNWPGEHQTSMPLMALFKLSICSEQVQAIQMSLTAPMHACMRGVQGCPPICRPYISSSAHMCGHFMRAPHHDGEGYTALRCSHTGAYFPAEHPISCIDFKSSKLIASTEASQWGGPWTFNKRGRGV